MTELSRGSTNKKRNFMQEYITIQFKMALLKITIKNASREVIAARDADCNSPTKIIC